MRTGTLIIGWCALVACGGKAVHDDDCLEVAARIAAIQELPPAPSGGSADQARFVRQLQAATEQAITASCRERHWSQIQRSCILGLPADGDFGRCIDKHQRIDVQIKMMNAMKGIDQNIQLDAATALERIKALRDQVCACHDRACARPLADAQMELARVTVQARRDEVIRADFEKIDEQLFKCLLASHQ
jgi:hypothetical protein